MSTAGTYALPPGTTAAAHPYCLMFKSEARTSRGVMHSKDTYFLRVAAPDGRTTLAEAPLFRGLSAEDNGAYESLLATACADPSAALARGGLPSSVAFALESAAMALAGMPASSSWLRGVAGIPINGLIWMGSHRQMKQRIAEKLDAGFKILKLKIGGIDFDEEVDLLRHLRHHFSASDLELRLDANGSFNPSDALEKLDVLAQFGIHSIEQPIAAGQTGEMARLCSLTPVAIALDEELIGVRTSALRRQLVDEIRPQYLVLKPALCGGFAAAEDYAGIIGPGRWWATSALESNVGLFAIARWLDAFTEGTYALPQGLGTGQLYANNISSPLEMHHAALWHNPALEWQQML